MAKSFLVPICVYLSVESCVQISCELSNLLTEFFLYKLTDLIKPEPECTELDIPEVLEPLWGIDNKHDIR